MAAPIVYTLLPNPHWVVIDNFSKLPAGAVIYTYSSLDPSQFKPAFQDPAGVNMYSQPIQGLGNGTFPPIYWKFDPALPLDNYYIEVWDRLNTPGSGAVMLWTFNNLTGSTGGGGGGGTIITASDIENLVVNNVFYRNIGDTTGSPSLPVSLTVAPSAHAGFVNDPTNVNVTADGPVGPDLIFAKNNTTASDNIKFIDFPLGSTALGTTNVTPVFYMQYNCTGPGTGETYKYFQFPISSGVQNLGGKTVSIRLYAICESGNQQIDLSWRQFFGSGGGSAEVITPIAGSPFIVPIGTDALFKAIEITSTMVPAVSGTVGSCGNDGLFLQIGMPRDSATSIDFIKPEVYLSTILPTVEYDTPDQIDSLTNTPRTGDVRTSINAFVPYGWAPMNDGTIANGNPAIVPPFSFARNNVDTFPLFDLLWNTFVGNQTLAPMFDITGAGPIAYGASSVADFTGNNQLKLTVAIGRVFAGVSPSHALGTFTGAETHNISLNEMPQHTHDDISGNTYVFTGPPGGGVFSPGVLGSQNAITGGVTGYAGPSALSLMQPTTYMNVYIKL